MSNCLPCAVHQVSRRSMKEIIEAADAKLVKALGEASDDDRFNDRAYEEYYKELGDIQEHPYEDDSWVPKDGIYEVHNHGDNFYTRRIK